jgi:hypothetical protein
LGWCGVEVLAGRDADDEVELGGEVLADGDAVAVGIDLDG